MTETIMQCCYTNAVKEAGGKVSSGWQAVVVSPELPPEAYAACVGLQNANATLQSHVVDERGNVLNLFELAGDGAYAYVSRTQFGLTDRLGRPNLFSHAYIFPWKPEVLSDPNVFLTLSRENFAQDEETAAQPREALSRRQPFTLESALERAGMTQEAYLMLIRCVWAQYSERKAARPLYIQYDGTEEQMLAVLYCVYMGIPYCMRRVLSTASSATGTGKNYHLIFSVEAAGRGGSFVVPQTGENNVLTPRTLRRIARSGFVEYAASHCRTVDADAYFLRLEKLAMELGDPTASDELILRIAHQLIEDAPLSGLSEAEVDSRLSDALRSRSYGSQRMEEYISRMLDEICSRSLSLTEASEANLEERLAAPATPRLAAAGERYNIYRLGTLPQEEAARFLCQLPRADFERYREKLVQTGAGLGILDLYYADYGLEGKALSWAALEGLRQEIGDLPQAKRAQDALDADCWKLYREELEKPGKTREAYTALMGLMEKLLPPERLRDCAERAKNIYWERQPNQPFSYQNRDEYRFMELPVFRCGRFLALCEALDSCAAGEEEQFLRQLNAFACRYHTAGGAQSGNSVFIRIREEMHRLPSPPAGLDSWVKVALHGEAGPKLDEILALRDMLKRRAYGEFTAGYPKLLEDLPMMSGGRRLEQTLADALVEECRRADKPETCVPFDVWLLLGRSLYPSNAFDLFDRVETCVVLSEEARALAKSRLLSEAPYLEQAKAYVQGKGSASKLVHKLLSDWKAGERRARREADGSLLDRSFALFSQLASAGKGKPAPEGEEETEGPEKELRPGSMGGDRRQEGKREDRSREKAKDNPLQMFGLGYKGKRQEDKKQQGTEKNAGKKRK